MAHPYLLVFLLTLTTTLTAQTIPYTLGLLDNERSPVQTRSLQQLLSDGRGGVYLAQQYDSGYPGGTEIVYVANDSLSDLLRLDRTVVIRAISPEGAYLEVVGNAEYAAQLLFVPQRGGRVDTLNQQPFSSPSEGYLVDGTYLLFANEAVRAYANGTEQVLVDGLGDCTDSPSVCYRPVPGGLLFLRNRALYLTDGRPQSTRLLREEVYDLLAGQRSAYTLGAEGLAAHSLTTTETTFIDALPGGAGSFGVLRLLTVSEAGVLFLGQDSEGIYGLYVSDGTLSGTRRIQEVPTSVYGEVQLRYTSRPGKLLYSTDPPEGTQTYFVTDGTEAGTYAVFTTTDVSEAIPSLYPATGSAAYAVLPLSDETAEVYYLGGATRAQAAVRVGRHPVVPSNLDEPTVINNRLLLGGSYSDKVLYSYGTTAGDVRFVGRLDQVASPLYATTATAYFTEERTVYATQGETNQLIPILQGDLYAARMVTSGAQTYLYAYDDRVGEALFEVNGTQALRNPFDLYPNTAGQNIQQLYGDDDLLLWTATGVSDPYTLTRYRSTDGTPEGTLVLPLELQNASLVPIGRVGDRFYYADNADFRSLRELDLTDDTVEDLDGLMERTSGRPLLIGDTLYTYREIPGPPFPQGRELIAINLTDRTTRIISTGRLANQAVYTAMLAYDGTTIYFIREQAEGNGGISTYVPTTGLVRDLGALRSTAEIYLGEIAGRVVVSYQDETFQPQARILQSEGLGTPLTQHVVLQQAVALGSGMLTLGEQGQVVYADLVDGTVTPLLPQRAPEFFLQAVAKSITEAVFTVATPDERVREVYLTDGTPTGTELLTTLPIYGGGLTRYGRLIVAASETGLYLIDPDRRTQEFVPLQVRNLDPTVTEVAFDRLYFAAVDPISGEELHYLAITQDADGDGVPYHRDCDDTDATVFPGATDVATAGLPVACARKAVSTWLPTDVEQPTVYPNPATTWLRIERAPNDGTSYHARLYDAQGRLLSTQYIGDRPIDLTDIPPGPLWLRLTASDTGHTQTVQFVKAR